MKAMVATAKALPNEPFSTCSFIVLSSTHGVRSLGNAQSADQTAHFLFSILGSYAKQCLYARTAIGARGETGDSALWKWSLYLSAGNLAAQPRLGGSPSAL